LEYEKEIAIQLLFTGTIDRINLPMGFFGIQIDLFQVALQHSDPFVAHQLCQREDIYTVSEQLLTPIRSAVMH